MQKRPHPIRVGLEIRSLPSQAIKLLACEGRLCWYSNTLLGYCVKIGMLPTDLEINVLFRSINKFICSVPALFLLPFNFLLLPYSVSTQQFTHYDRNQRQPHPG